MRARLALGSIVMSLALVAAACGGGSSSPSPSPSPSPTPTPTPTPTAGNVDITGINGNRSFNPNPGTLASDGTVSWQNSDGVVHRIVANDGSFDSGNIAPGAGSGKITIAPAGTNYHCSLHPTMIGAINGTSGTPPPCTGQYCGGTPATAPR